jgi:hypothetical protein
MGQVEEALVLLMRLVEHGGQARNMLSVVPLAFLGGFCIPLEQTAIFLDLLTQQVNHAFSSMCFRCNRGCYRCYRGTGIL